MLPEWNMELSTGLFHSRVHSYIVAQAIFMPERLTSYYLRLEVLLGQLLPPQHTSSSSAGPATATGRHLFSEGAYYLIMQMVNRGNTAMEDCSSSSSNSSGSLRSGGSAQLLHLAAVWHAIMRARARSYDSYEDRYVSILRNSKYTDDGFSAFLAMVAVLANYLGAYAMMLGSAQYKHL